MWAVRSIWNLYEEGDLLHEGRVLGAEGLHVLQCFGHWVLLQHPGERMIGLETADLGYNDNGHSRVH